MAGAAHLLPVFRRCRSPALLYACGIGVLSVVLLLGWPVMMLDTDLWFHLSNGKFLFEHHALPSSSFFSFIAPPREWIDYSWLFQAMVYALYTWWGYYGLIVLRAAAYLTTLWFILRLLCIDQKPASFAWCALVFVLCSAVLLSRVFLVRPHLLTYGLIAVFLYILEIRPHRAVLLPGLAVLWCNVHGITYPVMLLISVSYIVEYVVNRLRGTAYSRRDERLLFLPLALSMGAIFLTPHGLRLLGVPFSSMGYQSQTISEFRAVTWEDLFSWHVFALMPSWMTCFSLLVMMTGLALLCGAFKQRLRISHLFLCLGGAVLLMKGIRFTNEFSLLALPLLRAHPLFASDHLSQSLPKPVPTILAGLLMVMPVRLLHATFANRPRYPVSHRGLPEGVIAYLTRVNVGGKVLNNPNTGGYVRWRLSPRYQIFVDLEIPPFTEEDFYVAFSVFTEPEVFKRVIGRYHPSWITVPLSSDKTAQFLAQFPEYVLVFFDDVDVLYFNARDDPALAARDELKGVDPFEVAKQSVEALVAGPHLAGVLEHLPKLLAIHPEGRLTNHLAALLYLNQGAYDRAMPFAESLIRHFPELPTGYRLMGDAFKGLQAFDRAMASYATALQRPDALSQRLVHRSLSEIYELRGQDQKAYRAFKRTIDVFDPLVPVEDLYRLASLARLAGEPREAGALLIFLYEQKLSPSHVEWLERVRQDLRRLGIDPRP